MRVFLDRPVFAVHREQYRWSDVVLAAMLRGDWGVLETEVREELACLEHARVTGTMPSAEAVDAAAQTFRYDRELISADETEAWLERWGMTPSTWLAWVTRSVARRDRLEELASVVTRCAPSQQAVDDVALVTAVCGGHLFRYGRDLAARAAVLEPPGDNGRRRAVGGERHTEWLDVPDALARIRRDIVGAADEELHPRVEALLALESAYGRFVEGALDSAAVHDQVAAHHLDWIRVDCDALAFDSEGAAREAALCIREDGEEVERVAADSRSPLRKVRLYLDEQDGALRERLLSATPGELLGPLPVDGEYLLYRVTAKELPDDKDPAVRQRAEERTLARAVATVTDRRVTWLDRP